MARQIYIVELEVVASDEDESLFPTDHEFLEFLRKAVGRESARFALPFCVEGAEVVGKREG